MYWTLDHDFNRNREGHIRFDYCPKDMTPTPSNPVESIRSFISKQCSHVMLGYFKW